jgi:hypothetical protein
MRILALTLALLFIGPSVVPSGLDAQEGASLGEVETFMAVGRITEARETLENWWNTRFPVASRVDRQRGIWLRGKLTVDPSIAELDFRRLVLEYPGGPFTDDALFRLGLSAELRGDLRAAQASFEALNRDYPSSPRLSEARQWIREHAREIEALPEAPVHQVPVEESVPSATDPSSRPGEDQGDFAIQVGAFRSLDRALSLAEQLRDVGHPARVVRTPGPDLARVRVGRFKDRGAAETLAQALTGLGWEVTLATDAGREEIIGPPNSGPGPITRTGS